MEEFNEPELVNTKSDDVWRKHIHYAQNFLGSDSEYCRRNDLNPSTFKAYKLKFGFTKKIKRPYNKFVKIEQDFKAAPHSIKLPDAKWVASFVLALMNER